MSNFDNVSQTNENEYEQYEEVDSTPEPERYTVKIDGQDQDVTLDDLKNSYLRQSDYTKKTSRGLSL